MTAGALFLSGNDAGTFAILVASFALPVLSGVLMYLSARNSRFVVSFDLPDYWINGEEIHGGLIISGGAFSVRGRCCLQFENLGTGGQTRLAIPFEAKRRGNTKIGFVLQPQFTGELSVSLEYVRFIDALGIFGKVRDIKAQHIISVLPDGDFSEAVDDNTPDALADNDEYSMTHPGSDTSEIYAIRPYIPGDPIRSIHWKLTEKLDKVMVREFGKPLTRAEAGLEASENDAGQTTDGLCLCRAVPERKRSRLLPWFVTSALMIGFTGAFFSMLELKIPAVTPLPFRLKTLADGFLLLFNRLFSVSEARQAYIYEKFKVSVPAEKTDAYIFVALLIIAVVFAAYFILAAKKRSALMYLAAFLFFTGVQVYFGVFPAPAWSVIYFSILLSAVLFCDGTTGKIPLLVIIITLLLIACLLFSGANPGITELSETIRDLFNEHVEQPVTEAINQQEKPSAEKLLELRLREEVSGQNPEQPGGEIFGIEKSPGFSGSQIGAAAAKRLWMLWVIFALFVAAFAAWILKKLADDRKRRAAFVSGDCAVAINLMFLSLVRRLVVFGFVPKSGAYGGNAEQLAGRVSSEYAAEYQSAVTLWQEAVYSSHGMTGDDRLNMRRFYDSTKMLTEGSVDIFKRARLHLRLLL